METQLTAIYAALAASVIALIYSAIKTKEVLSFPEGSKKLVDIATAIREGANAYLKRQFRVVIPIMLVLAIIIAIFLGFGVASAFVLGAIFSGIIGYFGMAIAVRANVRTANAAQKSLSLALDISFSAGSVNGMLVVGLGLLGICIIYLSSYFTHIDQGIDVVIKTANEALIGYGFGAALLALFMRVGGGIFTKAADVGADLVGKVEAGIPEDDPRNPAVIADNVGDNVGDCAGMSADVFESYAVNIAAATILGGSILGLNGIIFPILAPAAAIISAIIGSHFVKSKSDSEDPLTTLNRGFIITAILSGLAFLAIAFYIIGDPQIGYASLVGIGAMVLLLYITKYYTGPTQKPVVEIAKSSETGAGTNLISGIAFGMESAFPSAIVIALAILFGYMIYGYYGIALAGMGMLATAGIILSLDTFGPISDNAQGMVEMAGLKGKAGKITAKLDAVGNTTKALTKGFAVGSAAIAASSLFATYFELTGLTAINVANPVVFVGLLLGAALPFLFSSRLIGSVGRAAIEVVTEVRRQFKEIKGIMSGKAKPDYSKTVDIVTTAAQKELIIPAAMVIAMPIIISFLGAEPLGGFLAGTVASGLMLAFYMTNAGGAWDNAKKYIEDGNLGGKGSNTHMAAIVGDTVGDPLKDTAGPALNPMMKIVQIVALLIAPYIITLV